MLKGTITVQKHDSKILRSNPLRDPHVRDLIIYLPPEYQLLVVLFLSPTPIILWFSSQTALNLFFSYSSAYFLILASILVLVTAFLTLLLAWRTLVSAIFLVLAAPFLTLLFVCRAVVFTALLVLAAPFFADLYVLGAALRICLAVSCTACTV
jgi:hypothetical protein